MRIAFLGLGRMGQRMAAHVVTAGHQTTVWNRSPGRAEPLVALGAREAVSIADAVSEAEVVVMMLADPQSSHDVLDDVAASAPRGTLVVDATTVGPEHARRLGAFAEGSGLRFVDAPVAGTLGPAEAGTLGSFVGGSDADVVAARPVVDLWCDPERVFHLGPTGSGNALKLVVNMTIGIVAAGAGEALRLAADLGVDRDRALGAIGAGPLAWVMAQKGPQIASDDHSDVAFNLDLLAKDLSLALDAASRELPVTDAALTLARAAAQAGRGGDDYAALANWVEG
jgi:3-hydroxyisobutyrate dehydrogenase-like beta-hydroxyacid dehydrogenase